MSSSSLDVSPADLFNGVKSQLLTSGFWSMSFCTFSGRLPLSSPDRCDTMVASLSLLSSSESAFFMDIGSLYARSSSVTGAVVPTSGICDSSSLTKQSRGGRSPPRLLLQAQPHHLLEGTAEILSIHLLVVLVRLQAGGLLLDRLQQDGHRRVLGVRRVALRELQRRDAEGPDVRLGVVAPFLLHHLGRHPARRADEGRRAGLPEALVDEPAADAEVGDPHVAFPVHENVPGLDVPVDVALVMEVLHPLEHLAQDVFQDGFAHPLSQPHVLGNPHHVHQGALVHEPRHQPQLVAIDEARVQAEHVLVVAHLHRLHLLQDFVEAGAGRHVLQVDDLDRHEVALAGVHHPGLPHLRKGASADQTELLVAVGRRRPLLNPNDDRQFCAPPIPLRAQGPTHHEAEAVHKCRSREKEETPRLRRRMRRVRKRHLSGFLRFSRAAAVRKPHLRRRARRGLRSLPRCRHDDPSDESGSEAPAPHVDRRRCRFVFSLLPSVRGNSILKPI
eukprot:scaffold7366_cov254-Pinguiococcus_pyrenoidosus.AAC.13